MSESLDRRIEQEIRHRLEQAYLVGAEDVGVAVEHAVVTLSGSCDQWELARMLRYIAAQVPGVERVEIRLDVRFHGGGPSRLEEDVDIGDDEVDEGAFQSLSPPLPGSTLSM